MHRKDNMEDCFMYIYEYQLDNSITEIGKEPENIKKRIETLFSKLDDAYPNKVIVSLDNNHKKWAETALDISRKLGYSTKNDFLTAYGYKVEKATRNANSVSKTTNADEIIDELKKRYPNGLSFTKLIDFIADNSDLADDLRNLSNHSKKMFGMNLLDYLKQENILGQSLTNTQQESTHDWRLNNAINSAFSKLEKYYPEKKVFSLSNLDESLRDRLKDIADKTGHNSLDSLLQEHGYEVISFEASFNIRNTVIYPPCKEPDFMKNKINNMLVLLEMYYPDHIIYGNMDKDHKSLKNTVAGLCRWFGYDSIKSFLHAYGYEYIQIATGRPSRDYDQFLNMLVEKYKNVKKPANLSELIEENPEYKGQFKTLSNKSVEMFGTTLAKHLENIGIIDRSIEITPKRIPTAEELLICKLRNFLVKRYGDSKEDIDRIIENVIESLLHYDIELVKRKLVIHSCIKPEPRMVIPFGVDEIDDGCFENQNTIQEIDIQAELKLIPNRAFKKCESLKCVHLPNTIDIIQQDAFSYCKSLESISLPDSLVSIGERAFAGCSSLKEIKSSNNAYFVSEDAFLNSGYTYYPALSNMDENSYKFILNSDSTITITHYTGDDQHVIVPSVLHGRCVSSIGRAAFAGSKSLVSVSFPDTVESIGSEVFRDCLNLENVKLSNQIAFIPNNTFSGCTNLKVVNIPDAVEILQNRTFKDSQLDTIYIGRGLRSIHPFVFYKDRVMKNSREISKIIIDPDNEHLKLVDGMILSKNGEKLLLVFGGMPVIVIPSGVTSICEKAFYGLGNINEVIFPETLRSIDANAFKYADIQRLEILPSIKTISPKAFDACNFTHLIIHEGIHFSTSAFSYASVSDQITIRGKDVYGNGWEYPLISSQFFDFHSIINICFESFKTRGMFDFRKIDHNLLNNGQLFHLLDKKPVIQAYLRLKTAIRLDETVRIKYVEYMRKNNRYLGDLIIYLCKSGSSKDIDNLLNWKLVSEKNFNSLIDQILQQGKAEISGYILEYKQKVKVDINDEFAL